MDRDQRVVLQPGLAAADGWARRHAALGPGLAVLVVVILAMYRLLRGSQSIALPEMVFVPLGLVIVALLLVAAGGFVLVLESSVAAEHATRVAPTDLELTGDEALVVGGRADGRRLGPSELTTARLVERTRPGRGVWRNLKDVVLQRRRDRVPDESYVELMITSETVNVVLAEAVDERARAGLRAIHAWMTGPRPVAAAAARERVRAQGLGSIPDARGLGRRLTWARRAMALAYPVTAAAAWALGARPTLIAAGLVLLGGLAVIGLAWMLVRPGAIARAAWQDELGGDAVAASGAASPWRRAHRGARLAAGGLTLALAASLGAIAVVGGGPSADARACGRGDHAACTRAALAIAKRDPAAAIALLAPPCDPPTKPVLRRCEALATLLVNAAPPHHDVARAEALYRQSCALGSAGACSLRRVLCGRERALPACAPTTPERASGP